MGTKRIRKTRNGEKGQNLVEFALVIPLLLLLVIGIAEFGRAWMTKNILTGAAREAVRLAVVPPPYGGYDNAVARANTVLDTAKIPPPPSRSVEVTIPAAEFSEVTATVTYNFPVLFAGFIPGLDCTTILLESRTTMRKEY
jgi:Flp pilus assembly protein TadG